MAATTHAMPATKIASRIERTGNVALDESTRGAGWMSSNPSV
jgi:hypothetical protein